MCFTLTITDISPLLHKDTGTHGKSYFLLGFFVRIKFKTFRIKIKVTTF